LLFLEVLFLVVVRCNTFVSADTWRSFLSLCWFIACRGSLLIFLFHGEWISFSLQLVFLVLLLLENMTFFSVAETVSLLNVSYVFAISGTIWGVSAVLTSLMINFTLCFDYLRGYEIWYIGIWLFLNRLMKVGLWIWSNRLT